MWPTCPPLVFPDRPRRLFQAVARWRLAAVGAVLVQSAPQFSDLLLQRGIFLVERGVFA
jgi:hypothetical protein